MKIPYFDAHCDTASAIGWTNSRLYENQGHIDLKRGSQYSPYAQLFAIFGIAEEDKKTYGQIFDETYKRIIDETSANQDLVTICKNADQARKAGEDGKIAAFISVEDANLLGCSLDGLERGYELGVRAVAITWNFKNALSGTNATGGGLTAEGKRFVKRMYDLGMLVDVSHISDEGFFDVCDVASGPIVATHSNSRAIWPHRRNLTDDMYREIVRSGGTAGINLYAEFLGGEGVDVDAVLDHMEHFLYLGGEKSLSMGGDLDGCDALPAGIFGIEDVHKIYDAMVLRGFDKSLADDIFYNNLFDVVRRVCK